MLENLTPQMEIIMLEKDIMAVAQQFAREVSRLEAHRSGTHASICLSVSWRGYGSDGGLKIELACNAQDTDHNYMTVKAASLGQLMDEVHRRCAFSDKMAVANDANDRALVAITDQRTD